MTTASHKGVATLTNGRDTAQHVTGYADLRPGDLIIVRDTQGEIASVHPGGIVKLTAPWEGDSWIKVPCEFIVDFESPARLEAARNAKYNQIEVERDDSINAGFQFGPVIVDSDARSRENIVLTAQLALLPGAPSSINWRMKDNSMVPLDQTGVLSMAGALGMHILATYQRSWDRKAALEAAQTSDDINAV